MGLAMILALGCLLVLLVGLCLAAVTVGPQRVRDGAKLAMCLLDLIKLLFTLRWKATSVRNIDWSVVDMFEERAASLGDRPAIIMAEPSCVVTYSQLDRRSNQVAHWAMHQGLERGDTVALVMPSCPDYVAMWLGMAKAGVCTALVNIHIKGPPLVHAIRTALTQSKRRVVVVDGSLAECVVCPDVLAELPPEVHVCVYGEDREAGEPPDDMRTQLAKMSEGPVKQGTRRGITWNSTLLNVYTSGTTGLPKASKINHLRFFSGAAMFAVTARLRPDDRVYCALPLYHSSGGILGVGGCWKAGCTLVIRARFSVRHFAPDCVRNRCTVVQYIGEVARYLVNSRETELDRECCIRVAFGNGLSPDVWEHLRNRYCIERIVEFYGSTEGNVNMVNNTGKVGAVGVIPWFAERLYPILLLRVSSDQESLVRDSKGRCIRCGPGEVGQLVGLINDRDPSRRFDGYTDVSASEKKMVRHVLRPGDAFFASGDLLRKDAFGFYFWVDRMGDTFRWKGENVATTEVAQALCRFPGIADVNVYGVAVPQAEGRVGMASIKFKGSVAAENFDWQELFGHLNRHLPTYAQPHFVRVAERPSLTSHMTTTFKHMKTQLRKEGFDPTKVGGDTLLFRDAVAKTFVPVTPSLYEAICTQGMRL